MINEQSANTDSNERVLLYDLWKTLRGEQKEEVALEDVKVILNCILRVNYHKRIGEEPKEQVNDQEIGFYNEKNQFCLRIVDIPKVQKHFNLLYLNRLQFMGKVMEMQKQSRMNQDQFDFKPQLNQNST